MLFWSFVSAAALNGVLAIQMAIYWSKSGSVSVGGLDRLTKGERENGKRKDKDDGNHVSIAVESSPMSARPSSRKLD